MQNYVRVNINLPRSGEKLCSSFVVFPCDTMGTNDFHACSLLFPILCHFLPRYFYLLFLTSFLSFLFTSFSTYSFVCLPFVLVGLHKELGVINSGHVHTLFSYVAVCNDELCFVEGEQLTVLSRDVESGWWRAKNARRHTGYVPFSYLGLYPRFHVVL